MKISIKPLDKKFSLLIRTRDKWTCQRCLKQYRPPTNALHCAHCFTRRTKATRFDPANACSMCYGCHAWIDSHPVEKIEFFKKRLGQKVFFALQLRTNLPTKTDLKLIELWLDQELKKIGGMK